MPAEKAISGSCGKEQGRGQHHRPRQHDFDRLDPEPDDEQKSEPGRKNSGQKPFYAVDGMPDARRLFGFAPGGEDQYHYHDGEVDDILPERPLHLLLGHVQGRLDLCLFLLVVDQVHDQTDHHAEQDRAHRPGDADLDAENPGGHDDGQDVDGRAGIKEGDGRPQTGAALPDSGEKRQHRAGAHRQDGPGDGGNAVGKDLVGAGPEVFHDRRLGHEAGDGPCDEKGRHQAEQHVLLGIPLGQRQRRDDRLLEAAAFKRQPEENEEGDDDGAHRLPDGFPVYMAGLIVYAVGAFMAASETIGWVSCEQAHVAVIASPCLIIYKIAINSHIAIHQNTAVPCYDRFFPADLFPGHERGLSSGFRNFRLVFEPHVKVLEDSGHVGVARAVHQRIVHPEAVLAVLHQACLLQYLQMLGYRRLGDVQERLEFAHAHVASVLKDFYDFDAVGVGQRLHQFYERVHSLSTYIHDWQFITSHPSVKFFAG
jgi:hypothetical protein